MISPKKLPWRPVAPGRCGGCASSAPIRASRSATRSAAWSPGPSSTNSAHGIPPFHACQLKSVGFIRTCFAPPHIHPYTHTYNTISFINRLRFVSVPMTIIVVQIQCECEVCCIEERGGLCCRTHMLVGSVLFLQSDVEMVAQQMADTVAARRGPPPPPHRSCQLGKPDSKHNTSRISIFLYCIPT